MLFLVEVTNIVPVNNYSGHNVDISDYSRVSTKH